MRQDVQIKSAPQILANCPSGFGGIMLFNVCFFRQLAYAIRQR